MGKGNLSKRKGLLSEITHDMLDYIAEKIKGHIETKVIDKAALENEKTQRETADDALLLRISEEEEAREKADSALEAAVGKERSDRETADGELRAELSKKVSKEDGKGLSDISGIDHMGHAAVDGTIGGNFANAREFYHEFVITHQSGTEDSISVYDIEQTCAVIDEKLSSFKPSDDVDLSGYYTSEEVDEKLQSKVDEREGYGLSNAVNVYIEGSVDSTFYKPTHTIRIDTYEVDESGSLSQEVSVYDTDTVNELIDTRLGISVIEDLSATEDILMLENGQEAYLGTVESITMRMPDMYNRFDYHQSYFTFEIGDIEDMSTFSITCLFEDSGEKVDIVWVGDDCNAEGVFTPQANTRYEIHIKCMSIPYPNATWVARVGAY